MKGFGQASAYVWSASVVALAAGLALPQAAHAQSTPVAHDARQTADSTTRYLHIVTRAPASTHHFLAI